MTAPKTLEERVLEATRVFASCECAGGAREICQHDEVTIRKAVLALIREEIARELREAARDIEQLQPLDESGERFVRGFFAATDDAERILEARAEKVEKAMTDDLDALIAAAVPFGEDTLTPGMRVFDVTELRARVRALIEKALAGLLALDGEQLRRALKFYEQAPDGQYDHRVICPTLEAVMDVLDVLEEK